jgi:chromosome segregation ATPase
MALPVEVWTALSTLGAVASGGAAIWALRGGKRREAIEEKRMAALEEQAKTEARRVEALEKALGLFQQVAESYEREVKALRDEQTSLRAQLGPSVQLKERELALKEQEHARKDRADKLKAAGAIISWLSDD